MGDADVTPFVRSAALYDALYADLPTERECDLFIARCAALGAVPRTILDLGCGTGRHAAELARRGAVVVGVDRSREMVARARLRGVDARVGDVTGVRLGRTFDAVIAMFHVAAYVVGDDEFDAFLATARAHLETGGLFWLDTWNAEAVRATPPSPREKTVTHAGVQVHRRATPVVRGEVVEVRYEYEAEGERFVESHLVRPRDAASVRRALERAGFDVLAVHQSATDYDLGLLARAGLRRA